MNRGWLPAVAQPLVAAAPRLVSALLRYRENLPPYRPLIHMPQFRRRLPHLYPHGKWLFVTWHLHGSLPQASYPPPRKPSSGAAFAWMDRYLDSARSGPVYLAQEPIAAMVDASLRRGVLLGQYDLGAYAIMANHVHVLLLPKVAPSRLLQSLKGATARQANLLLGLTGERFWQAESYDHWVRDESEWGRIAAYIEDNPVKAGLVPHAEDYRWSSAAMRCGSTETSLGAAATSGCATTGSLKPPEVQTRG
jgi:putative transposase